MIVLSLFVEFDKTRCDKVKLLSIFVDFCRSWQKHRCVVENEEIGTFLAFFVTNFPSDSWSHDQSEAPVGDRASAGFMTSTGVDTAWGKHHFCIRGPVQTPFLWRPYRSFFSDTSATSQHSIVSTNCDPNEWRGHPTSTRPSQLHVRRQLRQAQQIEMIQGPWRPQWQQTSSFVGIKAIQGSMWFRWGYVTLIIETQKIQGSRWFRWGYVPPIIEIQKIQEPGRFRPERIPSFVRIQAS